MNRHIDRESVSACLALLDKNTPRDKFAQLRLTPAERDRLRRSGSLSEPDPRGLARPGQLSFGYAKKDSPAALRAAEAYRAQKGPPFKSQAYFARREGISTSAVSKACARMNRAIDRLFAPDAHKLGTAA